MISEAWAMTGGGAQQPNPMMNFVFIGILILIFWVFLIQPQRKQQKEHEKLLEGLKKGDKIITQGGIHGTVVSVKPTTVMIRVDDNTKIEFEKQTILKVVSSKE